MGDEIIGFQLIMIIFNVILIIVIIELALFIKIV